MKYDKRALLLCVCMTMCFCVFVSRVVGEDEGNACCHQNQRVQRKKELNQVESCAFRQTHKLTPGHRQADSSRTEPEDETQLNRPKVNWSSD